MWLFLGTRYSSWQFFGATVCLGGLGLVLLSDAKAGGGSGGSKPLLGDIFVIIGTFVFSMSNVGKEFCVKKKDRVEVVSMIGLFSLLVTIIEIPILERKSLESVEWSPELDEMEAKVAAAISSSDDSQEVQELDVNSIYLDIVGGEKKRRVYGLGSQALTMYKDYNSATSCNIVTDRAADQERIKLLEEDMLRMKENQERILQERVEAEVQQRVEKEVSNRFKSMEDRWSHMMSVMGLSSRSSGSPTLPNRDSPNA